MDSAPLNLAHFHERRADKFLRHNRYDEANKAVETSLLYLQDAYKVLTMPKSIEVLNTQKWDYERKLRQIQIRKQQYERLKQKEIVPPPVSAESGGGSSSASSVVLLRSEASATPQSVAKSIDKTIEDFDAKCSMTEQMQQLGGGGKSSEQNSGTASPKQLITVGGQDGKKSQLRRESRGNSLTSENSMPSLAPLELPTFDFSVFTTSAISLTSIAGMVESFQK